MTLKRSYRYKDVDMLIGSKTIAESFTARKDLIAARRPTWAGPFIGNFTTRIDQAIVDFLGLDPRQDLKAATRVVNEIQANALKDLGFLKVQIEVDFATSKPYMTRLLDKLGFDKNWKQATRKDQQALTQVLFKCKKGLNASVRAELTAKGIDPVLIDTITGYAVTLTAANVTQEALKGSTKEITALGIAEFNEIYSQAIAICKICSRMFDKDKVVKSQFSFKTVIKKMNKQAASKPVDIAA